MYQEGVQIISKSNLMSTRTLVINQCDIEYDEMKNIDDIHRVYDTCSRGLSKSRNLAIANSVGDICMLSDDDEIFIENFEEVVLKAYDNIPKADVIIFKITNLNKKLGNKAKRLNKWDLLRVSSLQISFKRSSVNGVVKFDTNLGAGTGNGGGEENKFLLDCHKAKLKIYFVPYEVAELTKGSDSTWFFGFGEKYFYNLGASLRYILGGFISYFYIIYTIIAKRKRFTKDISFKKMRKAIFRGWRENKLGAKKSDQ